MSTLTRGVFHWLILAVVVCALPVCRAHANADPFAGMYTVTMAYDDNIFDGLSLSYEDVTVTTATPDDVNYSIAPYGINMVRMGNQLTLYPRPQTNAYGDMVLNGYALANAYLGAMALLGYDTSPPYGLTIRVGTWGPAESVTGAQLAGIWAGTLIFDDDLVDIPTAPFTTVSSIFTVTDLGDDKIRLDFGGGKIVDATISGSVIIPTDPNFDYFRMITDGTTLVAAAIDIEDVVGAVGDVSAAIALATLIPEPATLGIVTCGGLLLLRRRGRRSAIAAGGGTCRPGQ